MGINWNINNQTMWILGGFAVVAGVVLYRGTKAAAEAVAEGVDVTSTENWAYRGVSAIFDVIDDGEDNDSNTFGTWLYEKFNDEEGAGSEAGEQ